jgi:hypothetical protein
LSKVTLNVEKKSFNSIQNADYSGDIFATVKNIGNENIFPFSASKIDFFSMRED